MFDGANVVERYNLKAEFLDGLLIFVKLLLKELDDKVVNPVFGNVYKQKGKSHRNNVHEIKTD